MLRYAITPGELRPHSSSAENAHLVSRCYDLAQSGVNFVLVREKALGMVGVVRLTQQIVAAVAGSGMRVLRHGGLDAAGVARLEAGSLGIHLAGGWVQADIGEIKARHPGIYLSVSCHEVEEVRRARVGGADAVLFAPVFGKTVDGAVVVPGLGLTALRAASDIAGAMPVFALGGVNAENAADCLAAGAAGVAGIRMFFDD